MHAIDRVLIAIDTEEPEEAAIAAGYEIAARHAASVLILGVIESMDRVAAMLGDIVPEADLTRAFLQERRRAIEQTVARVLNGVGSARVEVKAGVRFIEVIRAAVAESASIIVHSARRPTSGELASDDWHLLRKAPVPVWIARRATAFPPRRIAVAIDVLGHPEEATLNRALLGLAARLARPWGVPVQVISAWRLDGEKLLGQSRHLRLDRAELQQVLDDVAYRVRAGQDELRAWLSRLDPAAESLFAWHSEKGDAEAVLPRFAAAHDVDLLMMGTLGRTGIAELLIGNTAETVLSRVECSVLTLKPSPFVTPVK